MAKPARPATRPWSSACWPSVAETCEREISSRRSGSAPILSSRARSWAVWSVNPPEIWAPWEPSMPSGFSRKLMYGVEISSLSSRIAKWCEAAIGFCRPPLRTALSWPRCAISRVVSANASRPWSVNSIVTIGGPPVPFSKFCSGFLISLPERTGLSLRTHHWSTSPRSRCSPVRWSSERTTMMPSGTSRISASVIGGSWSAGSPRGPPCSRTGSRRAAAALESLSNA